MLALSSLFMIFVLVFLFIGVVHVFVWNLDLSWFFGLRSWMGSFECGFVSQGVVENYFSCTYFVLLVFFVVFDLEVSLLLNMPLQGVLFKNFFYYFLFLVLLSVGFWVEISRGYVYWSY
uniref:NADH-ubiquinone oxidoreductase chain 3 n=1 Tax=Uvitellina sp. SSS-2019 TaxID=2587434 RepID=A0A4Y5RCS8_9TREM|nr:NADH dehydrogenase subunit 3 [Uvitellina sp. SSS-2019]QCY72818.1 NADH dehydrogenase subunit 3 [Uvitellina sp. SSS-2019]